MSDRLPVSPIVTRAIQVAVDKLGMDEVARKIGVSETMVQAWCDGVAKIPRESFLRLVDVLLDVGVNWDEWDKR